MTKIFEPDRQFNSVEEVFLYCAQFTELYHSECIEEIVCAAIDADEYGFAAEVIAMDAGYVRQDAGAAVIKVFDPDREFCSADHPFIYASQFTELDQDDCIKAIVCASMDAGEYGFAAEVVLMAEDYERPKPFNLDREYLPFEDNAEDALVYCAQFSEPSYDECVKAVVRASIDKDYYHFASKVIALYAGYALPTEGDDEEESAGPR